MAKINTRLASERLDTRGGVGGVNPVLLSETAALRGLSAPRINVHAADVKYTPMPVQKIQTDTTIASLAQFSNIWTKAAFDNQIRENKVTSDDLVTSFRNSLRKNHHGGLDSEGNFLEGFKQTQGKAARGDYKEHIGGIDKSADELLKSADPAVRRLAALRINDIANEYKTLATDHRSRQLKVEQGNSRDMDIESLLQEGQANSSSLFVIDNSTGLTKLESLAIRHGKTFEQQRSIKSSVLSGTFANIRFKEHSSKQSAYKEAKDWYALAKQFMPEEVERDIMSRLAVMKTAATEEGEMDAKDFLKAQKNSFESAGGDVLRQVMLGGEGSYKGLAGYAAGLKQFYEDPNQADLASISHFKTALSLTAKEDGLRAAAEQLTGMQQYARKNNIDLLRNGSVVDELDSYVRDVLPSALNRIDEDANNKRTAEGRVKLAKTYQGMQKDVDSGAAYNTATEVIRAYPDLTVMTGDTGDIIKEKKTNIKNIITYGAKKNDTTILPDVQGAISFVMGLHDNSTMFSSEGDFTNYLLSKNIVKPADMNLVRSLRKTALTAEGKHMKTYVRSTFELIKRAYRPSKQMQDIAMMEASAAGGTIIDFASIMTDIKYAGAEELILRGDILNLSSEPDVPPMERVENIKKAIRDVIAETGKTNLEDALRLKASGVRTKYYISQQSNGSYQTENISLQELPGLRKGAGALPFGSYQRDPESVGQSDLGVTEDYEDNIFSRSGQDNSRTSVSDIAEDVFMQGL